MKKTKKKSRINIIISSALVLIFAFVFTFIARPSAHAATTNIETLSLANINSGNAQGKYGNFTWDNTKLKSVSASEITTDRSKDPFCIVWTRPANGSYASALSFSVNVVDSVGAIDIRYDATVPSYISPGEKQSGTLTNNVNSLSSKYEKIYFYISYSYMYNDVKVDSVSIQIKATTYAMTFTKGTGIKDAYLSTSNNATSGSASGTNFSKFSDVYCFAKLDKGYKAQSGWTLVSGTANSEDAIYRVGSRNNISSTYNFGTINATAKTLNINRVGNGGSTLGNISLTYGNATNLGTPSRTGYEFTGWNTTQNGTGQLISSSLTEEEVNAIIDSGSPTTIYAQWSINAAGVDMLIESIGEVSYTNESKTKIDTAREAYNSLESEEQALVTKYNTLTAAETEYAKLKADNEAADEVIALINAIGTVEYTDASKNKIDAAREAYDELTADQKELVANYTTLTAAEDRYNELKTAKANADVVVEKISTIGTVNYPESKGTIKDARDSYDELTTDDERGFVNNLQVLLDAETELNNQKVAGANNVKNMINAIPAEIDYEDDECVEKIFAAREAYEELTEEQQALVDNYDDLLTAEAKYKELDDKAAAKLVDDMIDDIGEVVYPDSEGVINVARTAYELLTEDQKEIVTKLNDLVSKENLYEAKGVDALITAIGTVEYNSASKGKIDAAKEAYNNLTNVQKELVTNYQAIAEAEARYTDLYNHSEADRVITLINAIGTVEYTETSKNKIDTAKRAYDALTDVQKTLVTNYDKLPTAEKEYDRLELDATRHSLEDEEKGVVIETSDGTGIDHTIVLTVEVKTTVSAEKGTQEYKDINKKVKSSEKIVGVYDVKLIQTINGVSKEVQPSDIKEGIKIIIHLSVPEGVKPENVRVLHIHSKNDIEFVSDVKVEGKELVFEVDRLSEFALVAKGMGMPGYAVALLILGIVLSIIGICYLLALFGFNHWMVLDNKVVRVFKLYKKNEKVLVLVMPFKFKQSVGEEELFKSKEEAEASKQE